MTKKYAIIFWFCMLTVCSYCNTDFLSVKRHEWRCKEKPNAHSTKSSMFAERTSQDNIPFIENQTRANNVDNVKCCCSKKCKGLKSHQRSCRVIKGLNEEMVSTNDTETDEIINDNKDDFIAENLPELKPGIKLPKTETGSKEADTYFRSVLHAGDINISNPNTPVKNMNSIIYEYFVKNFGAIDKKQLEHELNEKYKNYGKQQLKWKLRELKKKQNKDVASIRLRSKVTTQQN